MKSGSVDGTSRAEWLCFQDLDGKYICISLVLLKITFS